MGFVSADELKAAVGPQSVGPIGHDMHANVTMGQDFNPDTHTVQAETDENSRRRAEARNSSGENKKFADMADPARKAGSFTAVNKAVTKSEKAAGRYLSMFAKAGVDKHVAAVMGRARVDAKGPPRDLAEMLKNPKLRAQNKQFQATKRKIAEAPQQKQASLSAHNLGEETRRRLVQQAIDAGASSTPLGPLPGMVVKGIVRARDSYKKWEAVGALAGGSYIDLAPTLKRS
jgi:hypothetical protein